MIEAYDLQIHKICSPLFAHNSRYASKHARTHARTHRTHTHTHPSQLYILYMHNSLAHIFTYFSTTCTSNPARLLRQCAPESRAFLLRAPSCLSSSLYGPKCATQEHLVPERGVPGRHYLELADPIASIMSAFEGPWIRFDGERDELRNVKNGRKQLRNKMVNNYILERGWQERKKNT